MYCRNCGIENVDAAKYCKACGAEMQDGNPAAIPGWIRQYWKPIALISALLLLILFAYKSESPATNTNTPGQQSIDYNQAEIAASVVNIYCESTSPYIDGGGGSGTILDEDGTILTNSHVIPQDETYLYTPEEGCLVILPDPITGQPDELYWAEPWSWPGLSDEYDIAFLVITEPYYDEDERVYRGSLNRVFPAFNDAGRCFGDIELGEPIRIFGYPAITGGYSLTVTDGVVSSFDLESGVIYTSAKISYGNSGGLAVDRRGCMLGIPTFISVAEDNSESIGGILLWSKVEEFWDRLEQLQN